MFRLSLLTFAFFVLPCWAIAQRNANVPDPDPELERKTFILPEGFEVNLFAADPMLAKPIQMNFDSKGRLWVAASEVYPQIKPGQKADDKILILEDTDGDGKADKTTVFAQGLLIPTAVEPDQKGGAWVANSTEMVHYSEPDPKTGKATKSRVVLSGFGTEDTHHILHTFRTGPDGMLYMSQSVYIHSHIETPHGVRRLNAGGIWQFNPKTEKLEVFARGWWNSWGTAWDKYGATFATDGAGGQGINYVVPGAYYEASRDAPRILPGLNPGSPKYCGLEILSGRHLPDDWQGNLITNDFRGHRVCRFIVKEDGAGFVSKEQKELIKSNHPAFRPIDVKMGPDGAIYIADWYNPIIQHGEVDFRDERRDHTHGRIWRITAKGRPLVDKPKISGAKVEDLLELLKSPEQWTRNHARRELQALGAEQSADLLKGFHWKASEEPQTRLELMWLLQSLGKPNEAFLASLKSTDPQVRAAACRIAGEWQGKVDYQTVGSYLVNAVGDKHPRVRLEAVRALAKLPDSAYAISLALDHPTDRWLDYAIFMALRETKDQWLPDVKSGKFNFGGDSKKLAFALKAAGESDTSSPLIALLNSGKTTPEEIENILQTIAQTGGAKEIGIVLEKCDTAARRARLIPAIEQSVRTRKIAAPKDAAKPLMAAVDAETGAGRQAALRLAAYWKLPETFEKARRVVARGTELKEVSDADQQSAFDAFVLIGGEEIKKFFINNIQQGAEKKDRLQFLAALIQLDVAAAVTESKFFFEWTEIPPARFEPIFQAFVNRKGGSEALAKAIGSWKIQPDTAKIGIRVAKANGQPNPLLLAALTKAGKLTETNRTFTPQELDTFLKDVKEKGDPVRGEAVYRRADLNCLKCHGVAGAGGQVGPDMTSIGASAQADYLLESLLNPNAKIKEGFNSFIVTTFDDRIITGIKVRETPQELVIRDAEDKEVTISKADKPDIKPGKSLMPDGLTDALTRAELVDLVRFLSELGKGKYLAQPGKVVRRWQAVQPTKEFYTVISRDRLAAVATDATLQWTSTYSTVFGDLPIADLPTFKMGQDGKRQTAVRFQFEVTTAGKAALRLGDVTGLSLWLDGTPIDPAADLVLDLRVGAHTLTMVVDAEARKSPLRAELEEATGSPVRLRILGGK